MAIFNVLSISIHMFSNYQDATPRLCWQLAGFNLQTWGFVTQFNRLVGRRFVPKNESRDSLYLVSWFNVTS